MIQRLSYGRLAPGSGTTGCTARWQTVELGDFILAAYSWEMCKKTGKKFGGNRKFPTFALQYQLFNRQSKMKNLDWGSLSFGYMKTDYNVRC